MWQWYPSQGTHLSGQGLWVLGGSLPRKYIDSWCVFHDTTEVYLAIYIRVWSPLSGEEDGVYASHHQMGFINAHVVHTCFPPRDTQDPWSVCALPGFMRGCTDQFGKRLAILNFKGRKGESLQKIWDFAKMPDPPKVKHRKHTVKHWTWYFSSIISEKGN